MSDVPSFERFDYLLRANKHIERKIVFDILLRVSARLSLRDHRYLGFGSMWFADFRFAHRQLHIDALTSIEREEYAARAKFNRPYDSIAVVPGDSNEVLQGFTADDWARPHVAWLDYDGALDESVVEDIGIFVGHCAPNSALFVTLNSSRGSYRNRADAPRRLRKDTAIGRVENLLGAGVFSTSDDPGYGANGEALDVTPDIFPSFFAECILNFVQHAHLAAGRQVGSHAQSCIPLCSIAHKDGADMITVGIAFSDGGNAEIWRQAIVDPSVGQENSDVTHRRLDMVPLTLKEKLVLDGCLPGSEEEVIERAGAAGLNLPEDQIKKYRMYYKYFPVFLEIPI